MHVKQISIFMENRAGRLEEITSVLAKAEINIRALSLADTSDFGILRVIVNKPEKAVEILRGSGFTIRENDVIACVIEDHPGGLHSILQMVAKCGISIEYMYGFFEKHTDKAVMIIRVDEPTKAIKSLTEGGIELLRGEQVYAL